MQLQLLPYLSVEMANPQFIAAHQLLERIVLLRMGAIGESLFEQKAQWKGNRRRYPGLQFPIDNVTVLHEFAKTEPAPWDIDTIGLESAHP